MVELTRNKKMILAVAIVASLMIVAASPVFIEEEDVDAALVVLPAVVVIAMLLAISLEAVIILHLLANQAEGGTAALQAQDRLDEAISIQTAIHNMLQLISAKTSTVSGTLLYVATYAQRQAEIAVAELWNEETSYDVDTVLNAARVYERMAWETYTATEYMSKVWDQITDAAGSSIVSQWNTGSANIDTYANGKMNLGFSWYGTDLSTYSTVPYVDYGIGTTAAEGQNRVYIGTLDEDAAIYVTGGATATIKGENETFILTEGYNNLASVGVVEGIYDLQIDRTYVGSIFPVQSATAAQVTAGAALVMAPADISLALQTDIGYRIFHNGTSYNSSTLEYRIGHALEETSYFDNKKVDLTPGFTAISDTLISTRSVTTAAANAAAAQWQIFDIMGESSVFLSPSSIIPDLYTLDLTVPEIVALQVAVMQQMADLFNRNATSFTEADLRVPADMSIVVNGTIRDNNGVILEENVSFTPLTWTRDVTLISGSTTTMNQAGAAAVWGSTEEWDGESTDGLRVIDLRPGYTLEVTSMKSHGQIVQQVTLESIPLPQLFDPDWMEHHTAQGTANLTIWGWLILVIGALLVGLGIGRGNWMVFIIGLGILGVGIWGFYGYPMPSLRSLLRM